ncbi:MAG TPA: proton-conducting transporter membrane subunit, partial [Rhizobiaceae bacterium]|nr:proton-conducting transporter membrane subunit [Rhizobiaceae bacterium]
ALAPIPAVLAAILSTDGTTLSWPGVLAINLALDQPGALLLGASALLWSVAGFCAPALLGERPGKGSFAAWWLLTLSGSMGVFLAADIFSFYLFFTVVSLAAYGLVAHEGHAQAKAAAKVYFAASLLGEASLLFGLVMLAAAAPSLLIADAVQAINASPWRDAAICCLILGFGLKMGLVPLHFWLPIAHPAAPAPASAVLSGAIIKAGVIGLIRFLPVGETPVGWGEALVAVGFLTAFWGVALGITQRNPKAVLAYSSVSQMGLVAAVFGMGIVGAAASMPAVVAYYALHHVLAKGALFLAVGILAAYGGAARYLLLPAAVIALGFGGLPLTGGALAKYAIKPELGYGWAGMLGSASAAGSTLLMLHFLRLLATIRKPAEAPKSMASVMIAWFAIAISAVAIPWILFEPVTGFRLADALTMDAWWKAIWPMAIGAALAAAIFLSRLQLPAVPPGDVLGVMERVLAPAGAGLARAIDHLESRTREWPVAGMLLVLIAVSLAVVMST